MSDDELDNLREKRKRELLAQSLKNELAQKKQKEALKKDQEKGIRSSMIVNNVLEPDAITHMNWLTQNNPPVAQTIKDTIILLLHKNELRKKITKIELMKIERQLTGQDSKIVVKRRGKEATDLDKAIKKEE
ncbi:MAG TPA: DNA-binding protein [Candidatus Bathyarchaeia archaeon]|nr:DNA-binding protein [Candidatus Bathyarchaeia archaeon]